MRRPISTNYPTVEAYDGWSIYHIPSSNHQMKVDLTQVLKFEQFSQYLGVTLKL